MGISVRFHFPIFVMLLILVALALLAADTAYLKIDLTAKHHNYLQVFWTGRDGRYSAEKTLTVRTSRGRNTYVLPISNAIFAYTVRVDIQQGVKGAPPPSIELHSVSCDFKWLFEDLRFDSDLSSFRDVRGMEREEGSGGSDVLIFTDPDPKFEFDMRLDPIYHQILLPVLLFLLLHLPIVKRTLSRKKSRFRVAVETERSFLRSSDTLVHCLSERNIRIERVVHHPGRDTPELKIDVVAHSMEDLVEVLAKGKAAGDIGGYQVASYRSGEAF